MGIFNHIKENWKLATVTVLLFDLFGAGSEIVWFPPHLMDEFVLLQRPLDKLHSSLMGERFPQQTPEEMLLCTSNAQFSVLLIMSWQSFMIQMKSRWMKEHLIFFLLHININFADAGCRGTQGMDGSTWKPHTTIKSKGRRQEEEQLVQIVKLLLSQWQLKALFLFLPHIIYILAEQPSGGNLRVQCLAQGCTQTGGTRDQGWDLLVSDLLVLRDEPQRSSTYG